MTKECHRLKLNLATAHNQKLKSKVPRQEQRDLWGYSCSHDAASQFNAIRSNDLSPLPFTFLMSAGTFGDSGVSDDTALCTQVSHCGFKMEAGTMASALVWVEGAVEGDYPRKQLFGLGVSWNHWNIIWYRCCSCESDFRLFKPVICSASSKLQCHVLSLPEWTSKGSNHSDSQLLHQSSFNRVGHQQGHLQWPSSIYWNRGNFEAGKIFHNKINSLLPSGKCVHHNNVIGIM